MADYIDRDEIKKFPIHRDHYDKEHGNVHFINGIETVMEYVDGIPTADVAPVVHANWKKEEGREICSNCGKKGVTWWNYCPECGAYMESRKVDTKT